jgi:hypothetical protein
MNNLSKKLRDLERNVITETPRGCTRLIIDNVAEVELHRRASESLQSQKAKAEELHKILKENPNAEVDINSLNLSSENQLIVNKSTSLYSHRVMELFDRAIGQEIHLNDPINKWIFYSRFNWFLSEMSEWLFLRWREDQIYSEPGFFNLCKGEQDKRLTPIHAEWRKDWLSPESWSCFYEEHKPQLADSTPEQEAEDAILCEQEEKEDMERDAKFLREKCPTCIHKCIWYEQNRLQFGAYMLKEDAK